MPVAAKSYTWDDIKDWPESANRTEIVDGELVVSPVPGNKHNYAATVLASRISHWVFANGLGRFFAQPFDVVLAPDLAFQSDLWREQRRVGTSFWAAPADRKRSFRRSWTGSPSRRAPCTGRRASESTAKRRP